MPTPLVPPGPLDTQNINTELVYTSTASRSLGEAIVRNLTGNSAVSASNSPMSYTNLSDRTALGSLGAVAPVTVSGYGPQTSSMTINLSSGFLTPDVAWTFANNVSGTAGTAGTLSWVISGDQKSAVLSLTSGPTACTMSANVHVNTAVSFGGHAIGNTENNYQLTAINVSTGFTVTGPTSNTQAVYVPATATIVLQANSTVPSSSIRFTTSPPDQVQSIVNNGTNSQITFTVTAPTLNMSNTASFNLLTELLLDGSVIDSNTKSISLTAQYQDSTLVMIAPATSNSGFANNGSNASMTFTTSHGSTGAEVIWTRAFVSGSADSNTAVLTPSGLTANLVLSFGTGVYGAKTGTYDVTGTLQLIDPPYTILSSATKRVTLRTGSYGLNFTAPAASVSTSGYLAQTSIATASAAYKAGTLTWTITNNGTGTTSSTAGTVNGAAGTATVTTVATGTRTVGQTNTSIATIRPVLTWDGLVMTNVTPADTTVTAQFLPTNLAITFPATSNNVFANGDVAAVYSSLLPVATHSAAGANVAWTKAYVSGTGDAGTLATSIGLSSNLSLGILSAVYGTKKTVYDVTASLRTADGAGTLIDSIVTQVTLRTGAYGLNYTPPTTPVTVTGYAAQTASSSASATYKAGTLTWANIQRSGTTTFTNASGVVNGTAATSSGSTTAPAVNGVDNTVTATFATSPVLTYDGFAMYNTTGPDATITATCNTYSFAWTGGEAVVNNQIGVGTGTASISANLSLSVVNTGITSGSIEFSKTNGSVTIANTGGVANVSISTTTLSKQSDTLTAVLKDSSARTVATLTKAFDLRAYNPNIVFSGASNTSTSGYTPPQTATSTVIATCLSGANTFTVTNAYVSGATLSNTALSGANTTYGGMTLVASADNGGAQSVANANGIYRVTATATFYDKTLSVPITRDAFANASMLADGYTLNKTDASTSGFTFPRTAQGTALSTFAVGIPTPSMTWAAVPTGTAPTVISNASGYYASLTQSTTAGSKTVSTVVTGTLKSNGTTVRAISNTVVVTATVHNPALVVSGALTSTTAAVFQSTASVELTAGSNSSLTGETYTWSSTPVSGTATSIVQSGTGGSILTLSKIADGLGYANTTYNVTCNVIDSGGQTLQSVGPLSVVLSAQATMPTIVFSNTSSTVSDYNWPVVATATASASMSEGGTVVFTPTFVSGTALTLANPTATTYTATASESTIGATKTGTYSILVTFKTPTGNTITTQTKQITASATLLSAALSFTPTSGGASVVTKSWSVWDSGTGFTSSTAMVASTAAGLTGETYTFTSNNVTAPITFPTPGATTCSVSLASGTDEMVNNSKTVLLTCTVTKNGQQLAATSFTTTLQTIPYRVKITPATYTEVAYEEAATYQPVVTWEPNDGVNGTLEPEYSWNGAAYATTPAYKTVNRTILGSSSISGYVNVKTNSNGRSTGSTKSAYGTYILTSVNETGSSGTGCVAIESYIYGCFDLAGSFKINDQITVVDPVSYALSLARLSYADINLQPCVRIVTESGIALECSTTAPIAVAGGGFILAPELLGHEVPVYDEGMFRTEKVTEVVNIGYKKVIHITCENNFFLAGANRGRYLMHHNSKPTDP